MDIHPSQTNTQLPCPPCVSWYKTPHAADPLRVFEVWVTPAQLEELRKGLAALNLTKDDSVRYYRLCKDCQEASETQADTVIRRLQRYYIA